MKLNIPFEKRIKFDTDIKEICSISLENEITKNESDLLGNFIFEGTYKENELSINETPFNFIVPFSVDFTTPVDIDSIDFKIDDFTYDIEGNELCIKINYIVEANEKVIDRENEVINEVNVDEVPVDNREIISTKEINNNLLEDDYVTYHVHIIKENETIEIISDKYLVDANSILKLNPNTEIKLGNKLIVPINYE